MLLLHIIVEKNDLLLAHLLLAHISAGAVHGDVRVRVVPYFVHPDSRRGVLGRHSI